MRRVNAELHALVACGDDGSSFPLLVAAAAAAAPRSINVSALSKLYPDNPTRLQALGGDTQDDNTLNRGAL